MSESITIVSTDDAYEALALRSLLEAMNQNVRLLREKSVDKIGATLRRAAEDNVIILSANASSKGLAVGQDWISMYKAFENVTLRNQSLLFSTAPNTRESGLVQVMLNTGGHLVAPDGVPNRRIIVPWIGACLLASENGLAEAVKTANSLVAPSDHFNFG